MKFFQPTLLPEPLGQTLRKGRLTRGLTKKAAARASLLSLAEIEALESDQPLNHRFARLLAVNYARTLGLNLDMIRQSLPPSPSFSTRGQGYLARMIGETPGIDWLAPFRVLAPLGRLALYLLLVAVLLGFWGMARQLSRVRPMPWITANTRGPSLSPR